MADRQIKVFAVLMTLFGTMFIVVLWKAYRDPHIPLLIPEEGAEWIKYPHKTEISALAPAETYSAFRKKIMVTSKPAKAILTIRAYKSPAVFWDGEKILYPQKNTENWKRKIHLDLTDYLTAGEHEIMVLVANKDARPALLAYCEALNLRTDETWEASVDGIGWHSAVGVNYIPPPAIYGIFPRSDEALRTISRLLVPYLVFFFVLFLVLDKKREIVRLPFGMDGVEAVRWLVTALVLVLGVNDAVKLPPQVGYDVRGHLEYIQIVAQGRLPRPEEGWSTFQSPLYHIVSAPFYLLFSLFLNEDGAAKALRFLPVVCGLLRVDLIYRTSKVVLRENKDAQIAAMIIGSFTPMNLYHLPVLNNETLSGVFSALAVLLAVKVFLKPERNVLLLGAVTGLAVLTKMSGVLLLPTACLAVFAGGWEDKKWLKRALFSFVLICAAAFVISGWYYLRNRMWISEANLGYWNPDAHARYWQDPSYRTPAHFFRFGASLSRPIYSAVFGVWDAVYSTMWCDGYLSGIIRYDYRPPWNYNHLISLAPLSLPITIAVLCSTIMALSTLRRSVKNGMLIAAFSILVYLVGFLFNYLAVPIYSAGKASYMLGVLPCFAIAAGWGLSKLAKNPVAKAAVYSYITSWALVSFSAFFVL